MAEAFLAAFQFHIVIVTSVLVFVCTRIVEIIIICFFSTATATDINI